MPQVGGIDLMSQSVYWLTTGRGTQEREKAALLGEQGIKITFVHSYHELCGEFRKRKAPFLIVSEDKESRIFEAFNLMHQEQMVSGIKSILSTNNKDTDSLKNAYFNHFRDIISIDLTPSQWLDRMNLALGHQDIPSHGTQHKIEIKQDSILTFPATIIWIGDNQLNLETNINLPIGEEVSLRGPIARWFKTSELSIKIIRSKKRDLMTRYAYSFTCQWQLDYQQIAQKSSLIEIIKKFSTSEICKVYIHVLSPEIKKNLIRYLTLDNMRLYFSYDESSVVSEPDYIHPDYLIVEDNFIANASQLFLDGMFLSLQSNQHVLIIGDQFERSCLKKYGLRYYVLKQLSAKLPVMMMKKKSQSELHISPHFYLFKNHRLSFSEIPIFGKLNSVDQYSAKMKIPHPVANFALCRMRSRFIKSAIRGPIWGKIIKNQIENSNFSNNDYSIDCIFSNNNCENRKNITKMMMFYLSQKASKSKIDENRFSGSEVLAVPRVTSTLFQDSLSPKSSYERENADKYERYSSRRKNKNELIRRLNDNRMKVLFIIIFLISIFFLLYFLSHYHGGSAAIFTNNIEYRQSN